MNKDELDRMSVKERLELDEKYDGLLDYFNNLTGPSINSLLSRQDIDMIENLALDRRLMSNPARKREILNQILNPRGFYRLGAGTNRIAYKHLEIPNIVLKVATSEPGVNDSPSEYRYQNFLKPYVAKCFDVSMNGVLGLFERVTPVKTKEEMYAMADSIYYMLIDFVDRGFIIADAGSSFFMNYGYRPSGPVLLDYPLVFEFDGEKLICDNTDAYGNPCGGVIDYNDGFDMLYCDKCLKQYSANKLAKKYKGFKGRKGVGTMKITVKDGNKVYKGGCSSKITNTIESRERFASKNRKVQERPDHIKVNIKDGNDIVYTSEPNYLSNVFMDNGSHLKVTCSGVEDPIEEKYLEENTKVEETTEDNNEKVEESSKELKEEVGYNMTMNMEENIENNDTEENITESTENAVETGERKKMIINARPKVSAEEFGKY